MPVNVFMIGKARISIENELGGKGASIERLRVLGFPVSPGIVLTTRGFERFLKKNGLDPIIGSVLERRNTTEKDSKELMDIVRKSVLPDGTLDEINEQLALAGIKGKRLIVRSSANVEDSSKHSFAGQFDTILDVKAEELASSILDVYASLFNLRALKYMESRGITARGIKMAVLIQQFVDTDFAGVAFTSDPVTGDKSKLVIEYVEGLGIRLVSGAAEPTSLTLDKTTLKRLDSRKPSVTAKAMSEKYIDEIAKYALKIEKEYGVPMDVEWGIKDGKVIIFQARMITVSQHQITETLKKGFDGYTTLVGIPASTGMGSGEVRIVKNAIDLKDLKKGEVMVCMITYENYMPDMLRASAIVTQRGGLTSHAAIVAREHKIPCVVGVASAMSILKNGEHVIVDASKGIVYHKGKSQNRKIPELAMDIIIERLIPYKVLEEDGRTISLEKSTSIEQLEDPSSHVLIEEFENGIVIHNPPSVKINAKQAKALEERFRKPVFIFGGDKYDTYTEIAFAMHSDEKFRKLFSEMKKSLSSGEAIEKFSKYCLEKDAMHLAEAERLLKRGDMTAIDACAALANINDAAIYFAFVNTLLTTGYGVEYARGQFEKVKDKLGISFSDFVIALDEKKGDFERLRKLLGDDKKSIANFDNTVDVYRSIAKWKFESDRLDDWDRRSDMWADAAKKFKEKTGHDVSEFLKGQYGSGTKLVRFFKQVGYNG